MEDNNIVESKGIYLPQDFSLKELAISTANGRKYELRQLLVELSYYEDIYSFVISGHITLIDAQGLIETLNLTGNEYIDMIFSKDGNKKTEIKKSFRVYKSGPVIPSENLNSQVYTLYFCSEELVLSEQTKISKSFKGKKISEIIQNILTDKLKTNKRYKIEETWGMYDFVIPKFKPFEAISWLSNYARPYEFGSAGGADMLFFETHEGFNFRSLQSIFADDVSFTYTYAAENVNKNLELLQKKFLNVLDYEISKPYDVLNGISSGTYANQLITIDPLTRTSRVKNFDYSKYAQQKLNLAAPINSSKNRLGKTTFNSYESVVKLASGNSDQQSVPYIKQQGGVAKDIFIETYVPNRTAQISLANYTTIKASVPGNPGIFAGSIIQFNLLTLKPSLNKKELDAHYSGKYLVSAVRHILDTGGTYQTILELSKDSSPKSYPNVDDNSITQKEIITGNYN